MHPLHDFLRDIDTAYGAHITYIQQNRALGL